MVKLTWLFSMDVQYITKQELERFLALYGKPQTFTYEEC